jgi:hypothetical protein
MSEVRQRISDRERRRKAPERGKKAREIPESPGVSPLL